MEIIKKEASKNISVRIPKSIYEQAVQMAEQEGVKPADVWRSILVSFFTASVNKSDTKMSTSQNGVGAA